jgi:hypothetical protein
LCSGIYPASKSRTLHSRGTLGGIKKTQQKTYVMGLFDFIKNKKDKTENIGEARKAISDNIENLIEKAASEPGLRPKFYKALLDSELIVLTNEHSGDEGIKTLEKDTTLKIISMKDGKIPVFTSTDRIFDKKVIQKEVPFVGMNGRSLFETTKGATLMLNPFSDFGKELTPSEIASLLDGSIFQPKHVEEIKKNTKIRIGQPAQIPDGLEKSLIIYSKTRDEIEAIYIAMVERVDSGEPPSLMIGIRMSHNEQEIIGEIGEAIQPHIPTGKHIDFMKISGTDGLSGYFDKVEPIYRKN